MNGVRLPRHVGFIPDGNRRWADARGLPRRAGYAAGVEPGLRLLDLCRALGIAEVSAYGFTKENVRRAADQVEAFRQACVDFGLAAAEAGAALLAVGDAESRLFPDELRPFARHRGPGDVRFNLLVNYGWQWDLRTALARRPAKAPRVTAGPAPQDEPGPSPDGWSTEVARGAGAAQGAHPARGAAARARGRGPGRALGSGAVPRVDLVVRWGGRRRLSGFLPLQCAYADLYTVDTLWPDMQPHEFQSALAWYQTQDVTLGG